MDNLLENSIEYDLNPFIIFNSEGKVIKYNQEAEYLLSYVNSKEIFRLALDNAPVNYGYKNSFIGKEFNRVRYYAMQVGYEDDEYILVRLYKEAFIDSFDIKRSNITKVNIYTLLELSFNNVLDIKHIKIEKNYDPSIPEAYLNVKAFMQLLNSILKLYKDVESLNVVVEIRIAKKMIIDNKKYPVCSISFHTPNAKIYRNSTLQKEAKSANSMILIKDDKIIVEFALVIDIT